MPAKIDLTGKTFHRLKVSLEEMLMDRYYGSANAPVVQEKK